LPVLILGAMLGLIPVGIYKLGTSAGLALGKLSDPVYVAVLPRLATMWAEDRRDEIRRLVREATIISAAAMIGAGTLLIGFRRPILTLLGGHRGVLASSVLALTAIAVIVNGTLFWNGPLLFAAG